MSCSIYSITATLLLLFCFLSCFRHASACFRQPCFLTSSLEPNVGGECWSNALTASGHNGPPTQVLLPPRFRSLCWSFCWPDAVPTMVLQRKLFASYPASTLLPPASATRCFSHANAVIKAIPTQSNGSLFSSFFMTRILFL